jgi:hypothetical protein
LAESCQPQNNLVDLSLGSPFPLRFGKVCGVDFREAHRIDPVLLHIVLQTDEAILTNVWYPLLVR